MAVITLKTTQRGRKFPPPGRLLPDEHLLWESVTDSTVGYADPFSSPSLTHSTQGAMGVPILQNYGDSRQDTELVGEYLAGEFSRDWLFC